MLQARTGRLGLAAICSLALAYAALAQGPGWNQNSHYALIRALASHTPLIDRTRYETGRWYFTGDISVYHGHTYSNKAPGFAFWNLPVYLVMKAAGKAHAVDYPTGQLWFLGLWGVVLPAFVLLLLVRWIANELEPGFGTAAALTLGLATLLLPFSTLFFSHVFSALLGFAAFAVVWLERRGPPRLDYLAAAGLLAGYAITTEFPNAITAGIVGCCVLVRPDRVRRALAYGGGALVGLFPLFVYNQWAFGSPLHLSYQNQVGFGPIFSRPSFHRAVEVLFAPTGILRTTPVLAVASVGIFFLYRRHRFEALAVGAVVLAFLLFESVYTQPFGGSSPGPRQLIPILPFLALPLATVFRRLPLTTLALAAASVVEMAAITLTHPIEYWEHYTRWFHQVGAGDFTATVLTFSGAPALDPLKLPVSVHWYPLLLFFVPAVAAVALAAADRTRLALEFDDVVRAFICVGGWLIVQHEGPKILSGTGVVGRQPAPFVIVLLVAAIALVATVLPSARRPSA